ncbi:MAG: putative conserved protein, contains Mth938-like domain [Candidatus Nitrotoga sp. CP45]|nr:MAG: putative conserved protein, contains Mth938-like domain [Candidatus Nitrotoga sp. CP45]
MPLKLLTAKGVILTERAWVSKWRTRVKLHLNTRTNQNIFTAHGTGYVTVSNQCFKHSIVVTPEQVFTDWQPHGFDALSESDFAYLLAMKPEIVLLGTGTQQRFPHPRLYQQLTAAGIGVESMDTPAACRTYNILMGEDRKVVAAILL